MLFFIKVILIQIRQQFHPHFQRSNVYEIFFPLILPKVYDLKTFLLFEFISEDKWTKNH